VRSRKVYVSSAIPAARLPFHSNARFYSDLTSPATV